ncbi:hypothetical protein HYR99_13100 [Candidatus Poribacteria bacterium]|nr:hypothetical protein [Candidatus Poribacteria bacterium]
MQSFFTTPLTYRKTDAIEPFTGKGVVRVGLGTGFPAVGGNHRRIRSEAGKVGEMTLVGNWLEFGWKLVGIVQPKSDPFQGWTYWVERLRPTRFRRRT